MIFQAMKKSTLPSLQGKLTRAHSTLSRATSRHCIPGNHAIGSIAQLRSSVIESLSVLPGSSHGPTAATTTARFPPGNPSTMAFLGVRSKSSGAAFRAQCDDEEDTLASVGNGMRVQERSVPEAWMVNLNRGDEEWLTGPRRGEWFTGLAPDICPGEFFSYANVWL